MKRMVAFAFAMLGVGVSSAMIPSAVHWSHTVAKGTQEQTAAAFRDGWFLGRLDAGAHRQPHPTIGRWSMDTDRRLFLAGYLQGYSAVAGEKAGDAAKR